MNGVAELFRRITLGVYVVGVSHEQHRAAFTAAWIMPAAYDPPMLALGVNPANACHPLLLASGHFAISVLCQDQSALARRFGTRSSRDIDKLAGIAWHAVQRGAPVLDEAAAYFECVLVSHGAVADRDLILARVVGGRVLQADAAPMLYAQTGTLDASDRLFPDGFD